jgi:hypothetical protein
VGSVRHLHTHKFSASQVSTLDYFHQVLAARPRSPR